MKRKFLIVILIIFTNSCQSTRYLTKDFQGTYVQEHNTNLALVLDEQAFCYLIRQEQTHQPLFTCCDTISYGSWKLDKKYKLLELTTPENLNTSMVEMIVDEKKESEKKELIFIITNPIEEHCKKNSPKAKELVYLLDISSSDMDFDLTVASKEFNNDTLSISIPSSLQLYKFELAIIPNFNFSGRNIGTRLVYSVNYEVQNSQSNIFNISIPDLTYLYLSCIRLNKDFVKIINKNKFYWDNNIYIRLKE